MPELLDKLTWRKARHPWMCNCGCYCYKPIHVGDQYALYNRMRYCKRCARRCLLGIADA